MKTHQLSRGTIHEGDWMQADLDPGYRHEHWVPLPVWSTDAGMMARALADWRPVGAP